MIILSWLKETNGKISNWRTNYSQI